MFSPFFLKLKVAGFIKQMLPGNLALGIDSCCTGQCCSIRSSEEVIQLTHGTRRQCQVPGIAGCITPIIVTSILYCSDQRCSSKPAAGRGWLHLKSRCVLTWRFDSEQRLLTGLQGKETLGTQWKVTLLLQRHLLCEVRREDVVWEWMFCNGFCESFWIMCIFF